MHEITSKRLTPENFEKVRCITGYSAIKNDYPAFLTDESRLEADSAEWLFFPGNEAELTAVIIELNQRKIPITFAGARTGLVGGCVPAGGAVISMERFDQVERVYFDTNQDEWHARLQAGVTLKGLSEMLLSRQIRSLEQSEDEQVRSDYECFKAEKQTYIYPPDPTEMSCSIGGSVVTNASGARTYRYGPTRAWVRYMRVFLANGEYLDIPRGRCFASPAGQFIIHSSSGESTLIDIPAYHLPKTKCATGFFTADQMDLIDLFIGSEGVLGVISTVEVALIPSTPKLSMVQFLTSDEVAIRLTEILRGDANLQLDFLEFYSVNALNLLRLVQQGSVSAGGMPFLPEEPVAALFIELSYDPFADQAPLALLADLLELAGADSDMSWVAYEPRELDRFKVFRHLLPETVNAIIAKRKQKIPGLYKLGTDFAVPNEHLVKLWHLYQKECDGAGLEWVAFGHIGNNHIHVNIMPRSIEEQKAGLDIYALIAAKVIEWGGAVSAEHGIGKIKQKFMHLMFNDDQMCQMKRIKNALDPNGLFNPGDIFPVEVR